MCAAKPTADASCLPRGMRRWSASRTAAHKSRQRSVFSRGAVIMQSTVWNTRAIQVCRRAVARMPPGLVLMGMPRRNRKRTARR
eukprot:5885453-Pyramimonas_sp.AAC.1